MQKHLQQVDDCPAGRSQTERNAEGAPCNAHAESDGHFRRVRSVLDRCLAVAHAAASPTAAIKPCPASPLPCILV